MSKHATKVIERGEAALRNHEIAKTHARFPHAKSNATPFALTKLAVLMRANHYQPANPELPRRTSISSMAHLYVVIIQHMNSTTYNAYPSRETLMEFTGMTQSATMDAALKGLELAGLLGVISGHEKKSNRYYILIHPKSHGLFVKELQSMRDKLDIPKLEETNDFTISPILLNHTAPPPF